MQEACQAAVERTDAHDWVHTKEANKRSPLSLVISRGTDKAGLVFLRKPWFSLGSNASLWGGGGAGKWQHTSKSLAVSLLACSHQCPRD